MTILNYSLSPSLSSFLSLSLFLVDHVVRATRRELRMRPTERRPVYSASTAFALHAGFARHGATGRTWGKLPSDNYTAGEKKVKDAVSTTQKLSSFSSLEIRAAVSRPLAYSPTFSIGAVSRVVCGRICGMSIQKRRDSTFGIWGEALEGKNLLRRNFFIVILRA